MICISFVIIAKNYTIRQINMREKTLILRDALQKHLRLLINYDGTKDTQRLDLKFTLH